MSFMGHSPFTDDPNPIEAQCRGKEAFVTKALAIKVLKARHKRFRKSRRMPERREPREPYLCAGCHQWHLGPARKRKGPIGQEYKGAIR